MIRGGLERSSFIIEANYLSSQAREKVPELYCRIVVAAVILLKNNQKSNPKIKAVQLETKKIILPAL